MHKILKNPNIEIKKLKKKPKMKLYRSGEISRFKTRDVRNLSHLIYTLVHHELKERSISSNRRSLSFHRILVQLQLLHRAETIRWKKRGEFRDREFRASGDTP